MNSPPWDAARGPALLPSTPRVDPAANCRLEAHSDPLRDLSNLPPFCPPTWGAARQLSPHHLERSSRACPAALHSARGPRSKPWCDAPPLHGCSRVTGAVTGAVERYCPRVFALTNLACAALRGSSTPTSTPRGAQRATRALPGAGSPLLRALALCSSSPASPPRTPRRPGSCEGLTAGRGTERQPESLGQHPSDTHRRHAGTHPAQLQRGNTTLTGSRCNRHLLARRSAHQTRSPSTGERR
jgi:hypothetical protein